VKVLEHLLDEDQVEAVGDAAERVVELVDAGDVDSAQVALDHDFHVVDLRVIARRSLEDVAQLPEGPKAVAVREAAEEDWDYLVGLATRSHYASRFYLDRGFPRDRCDALYQAWMERGLRDPSRTVHVPVVEGEPAGYHVLAPLDDAREGHGELVAIDERHRGRGVGVALEVSSMRLLAGRGALTQRTTSSARNLAASRLHERLGFLTEKIEVWHHKWYR